MASNFTPMMQQYLNLKRKYQDTFLFFRLGDFYEMFFEDAKQASKILHITLTSREAGKGNKVPMCGVPFHAADNYIARLLKHGKKVAICEQIEDASEAKGIVKREVIKVITPGTSAAQGFMESSTSNYILSLNPCDLGIGIAYSDISTGEFKIAEMEKESDLLAEVYKISPSEFLLPSKFKNSKLFYNLKKISLGSFTFTEDWHYDFETANMELIQHFKVKTLSSFGCENKNLAIGAAGALIKYLKETQKSKIPNINSISIYNMSEYVEVDSNSQRNLELIKNLHNQTQSGTLIEILDKTKTPMGKRRLTSWILRPLLNQNKINKRLDTVEEFYNSLDIRSYIIGKLSCMYDIQRLANRISLGSVNARDLISLSNSLKFLPDIKIELGKLKTSKNKKLYKNIDEARDIVNLIEKSIKQEPPVTLKEGNIIKDGYSKDLDNLRNMVSGAKDWISNLQKQEIQRTGISSLKIKFNKVFGYYIEVTKPNLKYVPDNYIRKQTLVNSERFITSELKKQEDTVLSAEEKLKSLEYDIFNDIRCKIATQVDRLQKISDIISYIDVTTALAEVAFKNNYIRPYINDSSVIEVKQSRHPVLENIVLEEKFMSNDIFLDNNENKLLIITGPNMAGKSTYIRQVALIVLMAQMGSFIPAESACIGLVDKIFTRVGASDKLAEGMSTFMVEMVETANILNNATSKSLIILDEIGRGTSTFDGVSIAWAVAEYINSNIKAKTLFATHYHELTELSFTCNGVKNFNFAVKEWNEQVIFLYKLQEGGCDKSFGIHVARLAGLPKIVIKRAREILSNLEMESITAEGNPRFINDRQEFEEKQLDLFSIHNVTFTEKIKEIDITNLTPLEALNFLSKIKEKMHNDKKEKLS